MSSIPVIEPSAPALRWHTRLHRALMPDYNAKATAYWWAVVWLGAITFAWSLGRVSQEPASVWVQTLIGMAIAMVAGFFPVRIKNWKNSFAAGEIFIFLVLLIHGPEAATLAAAGEAFVGSWRTSKRWTSRIFSPAAAALAMFAAGSAMWSLLGRAAPRPDQLVMASILCALAYFVVNALFVTGVLRFKRNEHFQWSDLYGVFGWVGIAYAASAAVAALVYLVFLQSGFGVLMALVPLIAMMLATLHYFFRQQEAAEAVQRAADEAHAREADLAARHVRELEASERRFHSAFTHASIGMALLSFDGRIMQANPALRLLLDHDEPTLQQWRFQDVVCEEDRAKLKGRLGLDDTHEFEGFALELRCRRRDGEVLWVAAHCSFFSEPGGSGPCLILQVQDISARRRAEAGLHHIAFHDALTGLPNRRRFDEILAQAIEASKGSPADAFAVMFLDFDRFKLINDSLGHNAGDDFLIQVSQRIAAGLRPGDVVARLGGDEFAVLVRHLEHERNAVLLAERLMETLRRPFTVAGTELMTSASIGITFSAFGYTSTDEVLRDADTAMYKAKAAGKARYALFDASLHTEVANRLRLEGELRHAIDDGQLAVAYQPIFDLASNKLSGFEALVRWNHPTNGPVSPAEFVPIAEEAGLMLRLSDYVLHCACHQLKQWQQLDPAFADLTINVNISGPDVAHGAFVARVTRALVESGLQPQHLCLELTENILMERLEGALPVLDELRRLGVGLAVDDFGTGYSSLSHLSTLPIDTLKIDRSFVARLAPDSNEAAVVRTIVLLGSSLGKHVVAEGIETRPQMEQLREMGCQLGQGYLLARPMSPVAVA